MTDQPIRKNGDLLRVRDAKGVEHKGVVGEVRSNGSFKLLMPEGHTTRDDRRRPAEDWFFLRSETEDYGLTILGPWEEAPAYQPLDDAGRAALKAGDEVLVRLKVFEPVDKDGDMLFVGSKFTPRYQAATDVFALLPKAPEPIAVGDKLRSIAPLVYDVVYTCVGFTSDGKVVAEYDAGDGTGVVAKDASCWERVS